MFVTAKSGILKDIKLPGLEFDPDPRPLFHGLLAPHGFWPPLLLAAEG